MKSSYMYAYVFSKIYAHIIWTLVNADIETLFSNIVNLALRTLVICTVSMTEYLTSEKLAKLMANDLSNVSSNLQSTWLSCKIKVN